jgi:S-adenosylmethionine hydrolase
LVAEECGIVAVRAIDEVNNRRQGSERSYTFHGRDVYAFVGARLAAEVIAFKDVGPQLPPQVVALNYERARWEGAILAGTIPALDYQYGNVWTNLDEVLFARLDPKFGEPFRVTITHAGRKIYEGEMPYVRSFGDVPEGAPLLYLNSLMNVSFALNRGDFAKTHRVGRGAQWAVRIEKITSPIRKENP